MSAVAWSGRKVHLVGCRGAGMLALSNYLAGLGCRITGSDELDQAHSERHLPADAEIVVHSAAVPFENAECQAMRQRGRPVVSYPKAVAELVSARDVIAVAGTHGKSSTVMYLVSIFKAAGMDIGYLLGAMPLDGSPAGHVGRESLCVVEACEFRSHFLGLRPSQMILTGIEGDHFDAFPTDDELDAAFSKFVCQRRPGGKVVFFQDSPRARKSVPKSSDSLSFGYSSAADWQICEIEFNAGVYAFNIRGLDECFRIRLPHLGRHNMLNATAAAVLAVQMGVPAASVAQGLESCPGIERRCQILPKSRGVVRIDDYAHHPTAIASTLSSVREWFPGRRLVALFQPHQANRTARLLDELAASLQNTDVLGIAEIYRAREGSSVDGEVTAEDLAVRARELGGYVLTPHDLPGLSVATRQLLREGDILVTMGAGQLGSLAHILD